ncbi:MAG: HD domain-containing protein [Candidatus Omnitrophota bacterium]
MKNPLRPLDRELLRSVYACAKKEKKQLYIVGGYLRDIVLKREKQNPDIDFCIKQGAVKFGRMLAKKIKAGFVLLDAQHGCCRLVKKIQDKVYTLDFTDFRGKTLEDDLKHRDFTLNTLALELGLAVQDIISWQKNVIDICGAGKDIKDKIIRIASSGSFDDDPLRILRAFSLACVFSFKIDKITLKLIEAKKDKLSEVSSERVRDELFKILETNNACEYLVYMDKLKILKLVIPEIEIMRKVKQGPYHHLDVLNHSFETVKQFEAIIKDFKHNKQIQDYLDVFISSTRKRKALIKLGAFLHDVGKPQALRRKQGKMIFHGHECLGAGITRAIARRLKLSNDEVDSLNKMVFWHLRPGYMSDSQLLTSRAKFRYFRDTAQEAVSVLLLSLADQRSTRGPLTSGESRMKHEKVVSVLLKEYFKRLNEEKLIPLINGNNLLKKFKLKPGPLIGRILSEIEELQSIGKIKTKQQALDTAEKIIKKQNRVSGKQGRLK